MNMENFDTEKFIEKIKNRPPLWDTALEEHSNRELKRQCWDDITDIFGGDNLTATERRNAEIILQKKWKSLRGCYTRELRRQEKMRAGYKPGPRKSEYANFQQMSFLRNIVTSRPTVSGYPDCVSYEDHNLSSIEIKSEDLDDEDNELTNSFKEAESVESDEHDPLRDEIEHNKLKKPKFDCMKEDEDKMFLLSMLSTLQSIPLKKKMATKIKLLGVLDEATRDIED